MSDSALAAAKRELCATRNAKPRRASQSLRAQVAYTALSARPLWEVLENKLESIFVSIQY
jgi:hypothetical protein